jgi:soluble lytic murein transglycosylase
MQGRFAQLNKGRKKKGNKKAKIIIIGLAIIIVLVAVAFFALKDIALRTIYPLDYKETIVQYAKEYTLDPNLVATVIWAESDYDANAESNKGAVGLMQIMPDTGQWIAKKLKIKNYSEESLKDPKTNIRLGCWYLNYLNNKFDGDLRNTLAAYNAGPGRVEGWLADKSISDDGETLKNIPYDETSNYVEKIERVYEVYKSVYKL